MTTAPYNVCVLGAGLAGSECAWQLARRGIQVALVEMRPRYLTPAHQGGGSAEMVCSNSLRSNDIYNAVGLIKHEMSQLDSLIMRAAYGAQVPAGSALAVDREKFSQSVSEGLGACASLTRVSSKVVGIEGSHGDFVVRGQDGERLHCQCVVIATGPLTGDELASWIRETTRQDYLYFYDSIAPIVEAESLDMDVAFRASRYGKDTGTEGDYINCPMTRAQYEAFIDTVETAELAPVHDFDRAQFFEGCLPIEEMVRRGRETLCYGPLKPIGLVDPRRPEHKFHAVVQLRQDNLHASLFNMVGFQSRMKWGEQKRIFQMIPGLTRAEFVRYGSMHRNTYICSPRLLGEAMEMQLREGIHFAGQITGCEGYVESAAVGLYVGLALAKRLRDHGVLAQPPATTALGALIHHILKADGDHFQPMNVNFGLMPEITGRLHRKERRFELVARACRDFDEWKNRNVL